MYWNEKSRWWVGTYSTLLYYLSYARGAAPLGEGSGGDTAAGLPGLEPGSPFYPSVGIAHM